MRNLRLMLIAVALVTSMGIGQIVLSTIQQKTSRMLAATALAKISPVAITAQVVDIGEVSLHQSVTAIFTLKNQSNVLQRIDSIQPECGCMRVSIDTPSMQPGKSLDIRVTYHADQSLTGRFRKKLLLRLQSAPGDDIPLTITGEYSGTKTALVFPDRLVIRDLVPMGVAQRTLYFTGNPQRLNAIPSRILVSVGRSGRLAITNEGRSEKTDVDFTSSIVSVVAESGVQAGSFTSTITLSIADHDSLVLSIPISISVTHHPE